MKTAMVAVLLTACLAQAVDDWQYVSLDDWLIPHREQHSLPGVGAILLDETEVLASGVNGRRSIDHDTDLHLGDRWHLGSVTKLMTATIAGRLVAAGTVSFEDRVTDVLPDMFSDIHPDYREVTLEQLLRHRSGLTDDLTTVSLAEN
jgi:CubicO group peptidase (beta-lactamase class C family)